jgi:hypothetical protein
MKGFLGRLILPLFLLSITLSCLQKTRGTLELTRSDASTPLEGSWVSAECLESENFYLQTRLIISGNIVTTSHEAYVDKDCRELALRQDLLGSLRLGETLHTIPDTQEIHLEFHYVRLTAGSKAIAKILESEKACESSEWVINESQSFPLKKCKLSESGSLYLRQIFQVSDHEHLILGDPASCISECISDEPHSDVPLYLTQEAHTFFVTN